MTKLEALFSLLVREMYREPGLQEVFVETSLSQQHCQVRRKEKTMNFDVVRAWKDEDYRLSLSDEERRNLPANPVGELELTDADLELVYGGHRRGGSSNSNNCHNSNICSAICVSNNCRSFSVFC